jgi:hypothetical protein
MSLRRGMGLIALLFPLIVFAYGKYQGVALQGSISAYYWANGDAPTAAPAPVRVLFTGVLFALAAFFYLYKGFTRQEDYAFNLAGIFAVLVACIPMPWPDCPAPARSAALFSVHGACAVGLFSCLVYVVWFRSADTLWLLDNVGEAARYRRQYRAIALLMAAAPLTAVVLNGILGRTGTCSSWVFFVETAGIWAFAAYWFVKNRELQQSSALHKALGVMPTA